MVPFLTDPAIHEDEDPIGGADGGEAVGDDHDGALPCEPLHCLGHALLGERVHPRGGLVEEDYRGIAHQRSREGEELGLAC